MEKQRTNIEDHGETMGKHRGLWRNNGQTYEDYYVDTMGPVLNHSGHGALSVACQSGLQDLGFYGLFP